MHNRVHPRVELQVEVTLESDHNFYTGLSSNISEGGLFVATHASPPLGTRLLVRFALNGSPDPIDAVGEVCWLRDARSPDFPSGFGLRFLQISAQALSRVASFVASRESIFYED
ncbi:MAG: TIGR02266 family protein [Deltaproteobacteria bacterium]|nr:TIGR02266 family protein [Deltaproteobacteria bacterium]